jgi:pyrimidine deaminase RibD-like protein
MIATHEQIMRLAIEESKKSIPEDQAIRPKVGVVVVKDGKVLASAHRGETPGDHAEYTVLEKKLGDQEIAGATVYTTLEPCTRRNPPKIPCAERLLQRKVSKVVIGMLDPNPDIRGNGVLSLRKGNVEVELFSQSYMSEVEEINRDFVRAHSHPGRPELVSVGLVDRILGRQLDDWYRTVNVIYWNRNFHRDAASIFVHLVEVVGGLSLLASDKSKPGVEPVKFVAKSIAWWLALCGKVGIRSVSDLIWAKFPNVCAYCHENPHDSADCQHKKSESRGPNWKTLATIGMNASRPTAIKTGSKCLVQSIQPSRPKAMG